MTASDGPAVLAGYQAGLDTGLASFETTAPSWESWDASHLTFGRFVCEKDGVVVGWCALSKVSDRCAYQGVAEVSVYVAEPNSGIGSRLLEALIPCSEANGVWTLTAGMFPENIASVSLHLKHGFRVVGRRDRIGKLRGEWRDTLLLERRSERFND